MADLGRCADCGTAGSGIMLDGQPRCDGCADRRLAAVTGWPLLPEPPAAEVVIGPERRRHFIRYRLVRWPTRVGAVAEELGAVGAAGFHLELDCGHFDDARRLVPRIQAEMRAAIARPYLKRNEPAGWAPIGDELGGYLEEEIGPEGFGPPLVVVDGQSLSWEDFGELLKPYVGWSFQLHLGGALSSRAEEGGVETIEVRPPTSAEQRAAARALRKPAGAFVLDSAHYPTPEDWARGHAG